MRMLSFCDQHFCHRAFARSRRHPPKSIDNIESAARKPGATRKRSFLMLGGRNDGRPFLPAGLLRGPSPRERRAGSRTDRPDVVRLPLAPSAPPRKPPQRCGVPWRGTSASSSAGHGARARRQACGLRGRPVDPCRARPYRLSTFCCYHVSAAKAKPSPRPS